MIPTKFVRNRQDKECGFRWLMGRISKITVKGQRVRNGNSLATENPAFTQ